MKLKFLPSFLFATSTLIAFSTSAQQTYLISSQGSIPTCSGNFFDSGNSGGSYTNNESFTITFCSDGSSGPNVNLNFSSFSTESGFDFLTIYDGANTSAPQINQYSGTANIGQVWSTGTCLTITFTSDGSVTGAGWAATIGCGTAPQPPPPASPTCAGAQGACLTNAITFPASTSTGTAESGPNYGCLSSQPRPAWYYFQIGVAGNITLSQTNSANVDVDGALWGPFTTPNTCGSALGAPIACDFAAAANFTFNINNAQVGQYYMLLITNFSGTATNITFQQTGGTGATTCDALCNLTAVTATPTCDVNASTYSVAGTIAVTNPPSAGTLTISDNSGAQVVLNPPFVSPVSYTIPGIAADGLQHTITATFSGTVGCSNTVNYTAPATPAAPVISGATSFCQGTAASLTASAGFSTYSWSGPNAFTASTAAISPTAAGTYTVVVSNPSLCSNSASVVLTENPNPTVTITGNLTVCGTSTTTLDAGAGFTTYSWTGPNGFSANTQTVDVSDVGTYTVTATDANGCSGSASADVANGGLTVTITGNPVVCSGQTTVLDAGVYDVYSWSDGTNVIGTNQTVSVGPGTYTVTVTDNTSGCQGTGSLTVLEDVVNVTITGQLAICAGTTTTLVATLGFDSYLWDDPTPLPFPPAPFGTDDTLPNVGQGAYQVTVTNSNGCVGSAQVVVVENDTVPIVISGPTGVCSGSSITLDAGAGYIAYVWGDATNGLPPAIIGSSQTQVVTQPGLYGVQVVIVPGTPTPSCIGIDTITVVQLPSPTPTITGNLTYCTGTTTLSTQTFASYSWQDANNVEVGTSQTYDAVAGDYTVTVTDINGCTGTSSVVTVSQNNNTNTVISGPTSICTGGSITLDAGAGFDTYQWATVIPGVPPTFNPLPNGNSQTVVVTQPGIYGVQISSGACTGQDTIVVTLDNTPIVPNISGSLTFCPGESTTLTGDAGFTSYSWSDGTNAVGSSQSLTVSQAGNYTLTVTNAAGCTGTSQTVNVTSNNNLSPTITGNLQYCQGGNTTLSVPAGFDNYTWTDNGTSQIISSGGAGFETITVTAGTYFVSVIQGACFGSSSPVTVAEISLPSNVSISTQGGVNSVCQGQTVTLNASGAATYTWLPGGQTGSSIQVTTGGTYTVLGENAPGCGTTSTPFVITVNQNPTVTITASGPTQFCNGSVDLTASGASTYVWSTGSTAPTINVTQSGTVTVVGTDVNGCTGQASQTISSGSTLQVNITSSTGTTVVCSGQPVTLDGTTQGASSYAWAPGGQTSPTISVTNSGTYTLTVTDATGCVSTSNPFSITVGTTPTPIITASNNSGVICNTSTPVTLSVPAIYNTYQWSNSSTATGTSISVNQPGTYTVTVTNASGCEGTSAPFFVTQSPTSLAITALGPTTFCEGTGEFNQVGLDATSGFDNYLWSSGSTTEDIISNVTGDYFVVAYNACFPYVPNQPPSNGGIVSDTISVTVVPIIYPYILNNGDTLKAMPPAFGYQWYLNGQTIPGAINQFYVPTQTGNYTVEATSDQGCGTQISEPFQFTFKPGNIGFEEFSTISNLKVFPNPASGFILIEGNFELFSTLTITISDVIGRTVLNPFKLEGVGFIQESLSLESVQPGIYFMNFTSNENKVSYRLIVE